MSDRLDLDAVFAPRSIAVVGASPNNMRARRLVRWLRRNGFAGPVYPVHPRHTEFEGLKCHPSLASLPEAVDAVAILVSAEPSVEVLAEAARLGVRGAVICAVGFAEAGNGGVARQKRLRRIAVDSGMAVVGPNCLGAFSLPHASLFTGDMESYDTAALTGNVAVVSQSGSALLALLMASDRLRFSRAVSSGNEAVVDAADYLDHLVDHEATEVVAMVLESIRRPSAFAEAARRAFDAGKPVVVLRIGRSEQARANVLSHSGALAGEGRVTSAFLRSVGAVEVASVGELVETLVAVAPGVPPYRGAGIGMTHVSGGLASNVLDLAEPLHLSFPPLSEKIVARLTPHLPSGSVGNPLDAFGADYRDTYPRCLDALLDEEEVATVVVDHDAGGVLSSGYLQLTEDIAGFAADAAQRTTKPLYWLSNLAAPVHPNVRHILDTAGIPCLTGMENGLRAIAHVLAYQRQRDVADSGGTAPHGATVPARPVPDGLRRLVGGAGMLDEHRSKQALARFGFAAPAERFCRSEAEVAQACREVGFPVVLKIVSSAVAHKAAAGGVVTHLTGVDQVEAALRRITDQTAGVAVDGFLVSRQVATDREFLLGLSRDPDYGVHLVLAAGGTFAEIDDDVALAMLPVSRGQAQDLIAGLRCARMLKAGWMGLPEADVEALVDAIVAMSDFGLALGDRLLEAEINPLSVLPAGSGVVMLDAMVVGRGPAVGIEANT